MLEERALLVESVVTLCPATPAVFHRFVEEFERVEQPLLTRQGTETRGGWRRWGDGRWQVFNLYRFESLAAMERAGAAQREDAEAMGDLYSWLDPKAFHYRRQVHIQFARGELAGNDDASGHQPGQPRQYVEIRRKVLFRQLERAIDLLKEQIAAQEAAGVFKLAVAYDALFGDFGDLTVIGVLPGGPGSLALLDSHSTGPTAAKLTDVIASEQIHLLDPLPYSPFQ